MKPQLERGSEDHNWREGVKATIGERERRPQLERGSEDHNWREGVKLQLERVSEEHNWREGVHSINTL